MHAEFVRIAAGGHASSRCARGESSAGELRAGRRPRHGRRRRADRRRSSTATSCSARCRSTTRTSTRVDRRPSSRAYGTSERQRSTRRRAGCHGSDRSSAAASSRSCCCSASCTVELPVAGLGLAGRATTPTGRPPRELLDAAAGEVAGTHVARLLLRPDDLGVRGSARAAAAISRSGHGYSCSSRTIATGALRLVAPRDQLVTELAGAEHERVAPTSGSGSPGSGEHELERRRR